MTSLLIETKESIPPTIATQKNKIARNNPNQGNKRPLQQEPEEIKEGATWKHLSCSWR